MAYHLLPKYIFRANKRDSRSQLIQFRNFCSEKSAWNNIYCSKRAWDGKQTNKQTNTGCWKIQNPTTSAFARLVNRKQHSIVGKRACARSITATPTPTRVRCWTRVNYAVLRVSGGGKQMATQKWQNEIGPNYLEKKIYVLSFR